MEMKKSSTAWIRLCYKQNKKELEMMIYFMKNVVRANEIYQIDRWEEVNYDQDFSLWSKVSNKPDFSEEEDECLEEEDLSE